MSREELSEDNRKEYDALTSKLIEEIEEELSKLPERKPGQLDGPRSQVYREVTNKYLPDIKRLLGCQK